jgi:hypothetical protein
MPSTVSTSWKLLFPLKAKVLADLDIVPPVTGKVYVVCLLLDDKSPDFLNLSIRCLNLLRLLPARRSSPVNARDPADRAGA